MKKAQIFGLLGGMGLFLFYFTILIVANSYEHAVEQFMRNWYLILPLTFGFGVQIGLFTLVRNYNRERARANVAAIGGISTGSMLACCAHHIVEFLPILGLSTLAGVLEKYQTPLLLVGLTANLLGVILMLETIKKHHLNEDIGLLKKFLLWDLKGVQKWVTTTSVVLIFFSVFIISLKPTYSSENIPANFSAKINDRNGVVITVEPVSVNIVEPLQFKVQIDTHSGSLDFSLENVSVLTDNKGNRYKPLEWTGSTGGHHLSGTLKFPVLAQDAKAIWLTMQNISGVPERVFEWRLVN